jgi:hypothetical protein
MRELYTLCSHRKQIRRRHACPKRFPLVPPSFFSLLATRFCPVSVRVRSCCICGVTDALQCAVARLSVSRNSKRLSSEARREVGFFPDPDQMQGRSAQGCPHQRAFRARVRSRPPMFPSNGGDGVPYQALWLVYDAFRRSLLFRLTDTDCSSPRRAGV